MDHDEYPNPDRDERGRRASDEMITALKKLERQYGAYALGKMIGIAHNSVVRCIGGCTLYHPTLKKIRAYLRKVGGQ